jgi:hypothetical protein
MSTLATHGSPKKPSSPKNASRRAHRQDHAYETSSSPSQRTYPVKNVAATAMRLPNPPYGTFLEDTTPVERQEQEEEGDPHDLSFASSHAPRASMVESMALALDQFSSGILGESGQTARSNSYDSPSVRRGRGHTFSSSFSSDGDIRGTKMIPHHAPVAPPRVIRRESAKYAKNLQKLPSIFGEDDDSVRAKVYDAQRAEYPTIKTRPAKDTKTRPKGGSGSASSSIDLGHLAAFQGRLGLAGNRRSRSFDFGSHQRPNRPLDDPDPIDVAPTPVIFPGPEAQSSPTKASFQGSLVARKNSTKSSKSQHARKARASTLGTAAIKNKSTNAPPPIPTSKPSGYAPSTVEGRPSTTSPHEATFSSRPGFFRRVFGSSKNLTPNSDHGPQHSAASARPSQDRPLRDNHSPNTPSRLHRPARTSSDLAANKENLPVLSKKPSSFFRRRKKSISNTAPPPLPLALSAESREQSSCIHGSIHLQRESRFSGSYSKKIQPEFSHSCQCITPHKRV